MSSEERYIIREARPEEFEAVGRVSYEGFGHHHPGATPPDPARLELLTNAAARAADGVLLVVEDTQDGSVVGTASVFAAGARLARQAVEGEYELRILAVDEKARRNRLGWRLLDAGARLAAERGADRLVLDTAAFNTGSQALYSRFGFERAPERDTPRPAPKVSLVVFTLDLAPYKVAVQA